MKCDHTLYIAYLSSRLLATLCTYSVKSNHSPRSAVPPPHCHPDRQIVGHTAAVSLEISKAEQRICITPSASTPAATPSPATAPSPVDIAAPMLGCAQLRHHFIAYHACCDVSSAIWQRGRAPLEVQPQHQGLTLLQGTLASDLHPAGLCLEGCMMQHLLMKGRSLF